MLSREGRVLDGANSMSTVAASALAAAGLPGLTARSIRRCVVTAATDAQLTPDQQEALASTMGNSLVRPPTLAAAARYACVWQQLAQSQSA
jgi:hypothetical protein